MAGEISKAAHALMSSLLQRKRVLLLGKQDDIRTWMAVALMQYQAGSRFHVAMAGDNPARKNNPEAVKAMAEIGIDMALHQPESALVAAQEYRPDIMIAMSDDIEIPVIPGALTSVWDLPDPRHAPTELIVQIREQIREKVIRLAQAK